MSEFPPISDEDYHIAMWENSLVPRLPIEVPPVAKIPVPVKIKEVKLNLKQYLVQNFPDIADILANHKVKAKPVVKERAPRKRRVKTWSPAKITEKIVSEDYSTNKLYLITTKDFCPVKVGVSYAPLERLKNLQTSNWEKLFLYRIFQCPGNSAYLIEGILHRHLRELLLCGEWFDMKAQIAELIIRQKIAELSNKEFRLCSVYVP